MRVETTTRLTVLARAAAALLMLCGAEAVLAGTAEVPAPDEVSAAIYNYTRATPQIATSGTLAPGGVDEVKSLGFKTILDLRTAPEGTADERAAAAEAGLDYHNIEIGGAPPTEEQMSRFSALVDDADNHPLLVHCASGNRVGTLWALHRAKQGVPLETALEEGRAIGMSPGREQQVRAILGQ